MALHISARHMADEEEDILDNGLQASIRKLDEPRLPCPNVTSFFKDQWAQELKKWCPGCPAGSQEHCRPPVSSQSRVRVICDMSSGLFLWTTGISAVVFSP